MGSGKKFSLFLENNQTLKNSQAAYFYEDPAYIIEANDAGEIRDALDRIKKALDENFHVAGWISYEAGLYFEEKLKPYMPEKPDVPFIYMGVFEQRKVIDATSADSHWRAFENKSSYSLEKIELSQDGGSYQKSFDKIKNYLKSGDIYQVNYTQKVSFDFEGSTKALYADLRNAQQVEYAAFFETDDFTVLSLSPELFIRKSGNKITTKPMKGTIKRGRTPDEDVILSEVLLKSEKERAEHLMIVDLLRNDLSKFAVPSSVNVKSLYDVEKYQTLFTMTSTIVAKVEAGLSPVDILVSVFPCGSVTGAPKIRAQQIISELENRQRGVYTGAIGYFTPEGDMCFSVPIRTISINRHGKADLGVGGAIVADSIAEDEYDECKLKAKFVTGKYPRFDLIETMKWTSDKGILGFDQHMKRLARSADYFSFFYDEKNIRKELLDHVKHVSKTTGCVQKIRLLLSKSGNTSITSEGVNEAAYGEDAIIIVSDNSVNSEDVHLFHKTTLRDFYQKEFERYKANTDCLDVLFKNEKGQLTEGSYTNLFVEKSGIFYTPPIECGLLAGIYRQSVLEDPDILSKEKILYINDLIEADQIYICNSVRGLIPVKLAASEPI